MEKKKKGSQKDFQKEGHFQGSAKVPLKPMREYGTGLPAKKPAAPLAKKKSVSKGK